VCFQLKCNNLFRYRIDLKYFIKILMIQKYNLGVGVGVFQIQKMNKCIMKFKKNGFEL